MGLRLTQFFSDLYMRRAFRSSVLGMKPNQIVLLGDLFDGGPYLTLEEYVLVLTLPHLCVLKILEYLTENSRQENFPQI